MRRSAYALLEALSCIALCILLQFLILSAVFPPIYPRLPLTTQIRYGVIPLSDNVQCRGRVRREALFRSEIKDEARKSRITNAIVSLIPFKFAP